MYELTCRDSTEPFCWPEGCTRLCQLESTPNPRPEPMVSNGEAVLLSVQVDEVVAELIAGHDGHTP